MGTAGGQRKGVTMLDISRDVFVHVSVVGNGDINDT